jgi:hypothetical protein
MMRRASSLLQVARPWLFAAAVVTVWLSATVDAAAQSATERTAARKLFEEGKTKRDRGDKAGALEAFTRADAIMAVPTTRLALARALAATDRLLEARDSAASVEKIPASGKEPQPFVDARTAAAQLVRELDERIPSLTFVVAKHATDEATITMDGAAVPKDLLRAPYKTNPGKHTVVATIDGRQATAEVSLAEKETQSVTLSIPEPAPEPPPPTPPERTSSGGGRPLLWTGVGIAALGAAVGTIAGIVSMNKTLDLEKQCRDSLCPPSAHGTLDAAHTWATVSTIGFIGAGVGVVLAGVGLLVGHGSSSPTSAGARTTMTLGSAGIEGVF